jgi:Holliday junction DNA helicase RuvA
MIGRIAGTLLEKNPPQLLIDCQGVGYEVDVPMSTFYNLPPLGEKVVLLTHLAIREDAHVLFGFGSAEERATFRQLVKISGVGARTALSILSGMSVADLSQAITMQEVGRLTRIPGIGKKLPSACCWNSKANSVPIYLRPVWRLRQVIIAPTF